MKQALQKMMPALGFLMLCTVICQAPGYATGAEKKISLQQATEGLTRLGVPLQRDPGGAVRWIEAAEIQMSDEALRYLPGLPELEWLEIGSGNISPSGLAVLKNCRSLRRLYIRNVNLAADDLAWLSHLTKLEALALPHTGIDGRVVKNIKAIDTLTVLNLSGNDIRDDDLPAIALLKKLEVLALADTKVTGIGISRLQGMPRLNELNLMRCAISDADLEYFMSMPNLRIVYAEGCNLSPCAIQQMRFRFPMLAIFQ